MLAIRIVDDPLIETLAIVASAGAVISTAVAAGIEAASLVALLAARDRYRSQARRYTEIRCQEGVWRVLRSDGSVARIEAPAVRIGHRELIVLGIVDAGRRGSLVFSRASASRDDLRKLRVLLRTGALSSLSSSFASGKGAFSAQ